MEPLILEQSSLVFRKNNIGSRWDCRSCSRWKESLQPLPEMKSHSWGLKLPLYPKASIIRQENAQRLDSNVKICCPLPGSSDLVTFDDPKGVEQLLKQKEYIYIYNWQREQLAASADPAFGPVCGYQNPGVQPASQSQGASQWLGITVS